MPRGVDAGAGNNEKGGGRNEVSSGCKDLGVDIAGSGDLPSEGFEKESELRFFL